MLLPPDYHMHTPLCRHAVGEPHEYAARAVEVGLSEIGFSDHSPMSRDDFDDWRMFDRQLDEYVEKVRRAQQQFPELTIRLALEVDYLPGQEDWIRSLATRHPWDYFIGSVHYVENRWDVDNPNKLAEWQKRDVDEVWRRYVDRLNQSAASGLFDIIGHCDLPKKFGHRTTKDLSPQYQEFLATAAANAVAIEINTAGLRKDCREMYPSRTILELAFAAGVQITFGSDAHAPGEVGADFGHAVALARQVGYTQACRFVGRKRAVVAL